MKLRRVLAVAVSVTIGLFATAIPAHADDQPSSKAAAWIVTNTSDTSAWKPGTAADQVLALASTADTQYREAIDSRITYLKDNASTYVKEGGEAAAKLAIAAESVDEDPTDFGGVNLLTTIRDAIGEDGAFGAWPGPFATGIAAVALSRGGEEIPASMITYLLTYQGSDGGFAFEVNKAGSAASDADSTSLAILALQAANTKNATPDSEKALTDATGWLEKNQQKDGSWAGYSPVNSTGMAAPLLGEQWSKAGADYVTAQQLPDGSLPNGDGTTTGNELATVQGILALTGKSYATISFTPDAVADPTAPLMSNEVGIGVGVVVLVAALAGIVVSLRSGSRTEN